MKDEKILQLLKGSLDDLKLGMHFLGARSYDEVKYFMEKYGYHTDNNSQSTYLLSSHIIHVKNEITNSVIYLKSKNFWLAGYVSQLQMLNPTYYIPYKENIIKTWTEI